MLRLLSPPFTVARLVANNFSSSSAVYANRAIIYTSNGSPPSVLSCRTFPSLPSPPPNTLNIKFLLAPINPADINVIEGVYPAKPSPTKLNNEGAVFVAGNEGLAVVTGVGSGVEGFNEGEWVVVGKQQSGTWRSGANVEVGDVIKVPKGASEVGAATVAVNYFIKMFCAGADVCVGQSSDGL
jgi:mitochondrial enoyl-[acyl-carrier protein] reductase / trans-2-enoyl-CoA reductase